MIEPVVHPDRYVLQDVDQATYPHYYGFLNEIGDWYIMREASDLSVRFFRVSFRQVGLYYTNWVNRATLNYMFWDSTF